SAPGTLGRVPVLESVEDRLFLAWVEDPAPRRDQPSAETPVSELRGAWLNTRGGYLMEPFHIGPASRTTWNLNAAMSQDGQVALVYDGAFETRASDLYLAKIHRDQAYLFRVSADDGHDSKYPDIALRGDLAALTWFDARHGNNEVYLRYFD